MDYSRRRLTLVDDTLAAFAGIAHVLSRVFAGGFVFGMPLMFLDIALLWRPPFLPSWSWIGWWFDGVPVDLGLWRAAADYVEEARADASGRAQAAPSFRVRPTVAAWSLTNRVQTVRVASNGLQYRELRGRRNQGAALPASSGTSSPSRSGPKRPTGRRRRARRRTRARCWRSGPRAASSRSTTPCP